MTFHEKKSYSKNTEPLEVRKNSFSKEKIFSKVFTRKKTMWVTVFGHGESRGAVRFSKKSLYNELRKSRFFQIS